MQRGRFEGRNRGEQAAGGRFRPVVVGSGAAVQWCAPGGQDQMCGRYANHPIRLQDLKWLISAGSGAACFIAKNGDVGEHKDGGEKAPRVSTSPRGQLRGKASEGENSPGSSCPGSQQVTAVGFWRTRQAWREHKGSM